MKAAMLMICVASGILAGMLGGGMTHAFSIIFLSIGLRVLMAYLATRKPYILITFKNLHYAWITFLFIGTGMLAYNMEKPYPGNIGSDIVVGIKGSVVQRVTTTRGERYIINVDKLQRNIAEESEQENAQQNIQESIHKTIEERCNNFKLYLYADADVVFKPGDEIYYIASMKAIENPTPGRPLYFTQCARRGEQPELAGHHDNILTFAASLREKLKIALENSALNKEACGLVKGLLLADRGEINEFRISEFRDAGLSHMLAVSGMHVGIIAGILLWLTMPLTLFGSRNFRYIVVIICIWGFAFLTGLSYSTLRASLMLTLGCIAYILERQREGFASVCVAGSIILLISPDAIADLGFILSYTCVASLCLFVERFNPIDHRSHPGTHKICTALLTTIVATAATWLITGYYFSQLSTTFLIANFIVLPLLPAYMFLAIIHLACSIFQFDISIIPTILNYSTDVLYRFIDLFAGTSVYFSVDVISLILWVAGMILMGISLYIIPPKIHSDAVISHASAEFSKPWLYASLATFALSLAFLAYHNFKLMSI